MTLTQTIKQQALRLGFQAVGIAPASALNNRAGELRRWLAQGYAGGLKYMENFLARQARYLQRFPEIKSFIVLTAPYSTHSHGTWYRFPDWVPGTDFEGGKEPVGQIARYAWGQDYHDVLQKRLKPLANYIQSQTAMAAQISISIDTSPIQERALAEAAGLGFTGKNTCLILPKAGSFFFLAVLATNLDLEPDTPTRRDCGNCTLCIEACPTGALRKPYELDAGRCISCLTIEHKGEIPEALRPLLGHWLFGCDICQEVCPHNMMSLRDPAAFSSFRDPQGREISSPFPEFAPSAGAGEALPLQEVLSIRTEEDFAARFSHTPLMRAKREGLLRNASIVAGNSRNPALAPTLTDTAQNDPSPLVREHASWALDQLTAPPPTLGLLKANPDDVSSNTI